MVRIIQRENPDDTMLFFPNIKNLPIDFDKFPEMSDTKSFPVLGYSRIIGWPSWFPIFNRRRVYDFNFPVKGGE